MNNYEIFQLLLFLDLQSQRDFETIKEALAIVHSTEIKSEKKYGLILNLFRNAALLDNEFVKSMPQELRESIISEYIRKAEKKSRNHGNKKRQIRTGKS
ncbi:hypothetical protein [Fluviicola sp.]|uniref:hypothetical protein n=1 Tax=Fluviicola sp. TaxID=1917219 RepID=UPI0026210BDE|nr:hypothetical protein [Fluviicola sp.]